MFEVLFYPLAAVIVTIGLMGISFIALVAEWCHVSRQEREARAALIRDMLSEPAMPAGYGVGAAWQAWGREIERREAELSRTILEAEDVAAAAWKEWSR